MQSAPPNPTADGGITTEALITSLHPALKCTIHCAEFGCLLSLSATRRGDGGGDARGSGTKPDVKSLCLVRTDDYSTDGNAGGFPDGGVGSSSLAGEATEIPLLMKPSPTMAPSSRNRGNRQSSSSSSGRGGAEALLRVVSELGEKLNERLADAANAAPALHRGEDMGGDGVEGFLRRSEAVFGEFLSAVRQRLRMEERELSSRDNKLAGKKRRRMEAMSPHATDGNTQLIPVRFYASLVAQLRLLDRMDGILDVDVDDDLTIITVACLDGAKRRHELHVEILDPTTFPQQTPIFTADLPVEFEPKWTMRGLLTKAVGLVAEDDSSAIMTAPLTATTGGGLIGACQNFASVLAHFQNLWDELDDLDAHAWVLEPSLPARRSSSERRIAIRTGLSLILTLDIDRPRSAPVSMRIVGAASDMASLRSSYARFVAGPLEQSGDKASKETHSIAESEEGNKMANDAVLSPPTHEFWSEDLTVRSNLERWLGAPLPSPATTEKADYVAECGICYAHRLPAEDSEEGGGIIPDATCGNPSCARSYHESCLFEWLHSLPSARISFDRVFGTCPYCCEPLSVRARDGSR